MRHPRGEYILKKTPGERVDEVFLKNIHPGGATQVCTFRGKLLVGLNSTMSMYGNAGRFLRDAPEFGAREVSSPTEEESSVIACSSLEEEESFAHAGCSLEEPFDHANCSSEEQAPDPPSTLVITRRQKDFGVVKECAQQANIPPTAENGSTRDLVAVSMSVFIQYVRHP